MEEKNKNWNLKKLERQAMENQNFDNFVLNQSKILEYENLKVLDVGCSNGCKTEMLFGQYENIDNINESFIAIDEITVILSILKNTCVLCFNLRYASE